MLEYALRGLDEKASESCGPSPRSDAGAVRHPRRAAGGSPTTPSPVATGEGRGEGKPFATDRELDAALTELEDRGLLGWDRRANRYDLHPIVRGVAWKGLDAAAQQGVYTGLHDHFESLPKIDDWRKVESLEDLTPAIELYNTLIGLGRYDDACVVFRDGSATPRSTA